MLMYFIFVYCSIYRLRFVTSIFDLSSPLAELRLAASVDVIADSWQKYIARSCAVVVTIPHLHLLVRSSSCLLHICSVTSSLVRLLKWRSSLLVFPGDYLLFGQQLISSFHIGPFAEVKIFYFFPESGGQQRLSRSFCLHRQLHSLLDSQRAILDIINILTQFHIY